MKKLFVIMAMVAALALMVVPAYADQVGTVEVNVVVSQWVHINVPSPAHIYVLDFIGSPFGTSVGCTVTSNTSWNINTAWTSGPHHSNGKAGSVNVTGTGSQFPVYIHFEADHLDTDNTTLLAPGTYIDTYTMTISTTP